MWSLIGILLLKGEKANSKLLRLTALPRDEEADLSFIYVSGGLHVKKKAIYRAVFPKSGPSRYGALLEILVDSTSGKCLVEERPLLKMLGIEAIHLASTLVGERQLRGHP